MIAEAAAKKKAEEDEAARVAEEAKAKAMEDVENQLTAFAESVGMPVEKMWEGVTRGEGGVILKIKWGNKDLKGTLPGTVEGIR